MPPVLGLRGDGERRDSAALPGAVAVVHLNADEGRAGSGAVARVDAELQDAEHEASHEARPHAGQCVHGLDRQLAEEGQHEVLQKVVAEDAHPWGLLPRLKGPTPKLVLHWWPHLLSHAQSLWWGI